jgi:NAD(P)-dependent dehydrogenase (short-subunit alcohol dehydrogenase family)
VIGLTRTLALEDAPYGVTVNAIAPGPMMTAMLAAREAIASVHVFLASDEAAFITGPVIVVNGGMSVGI